MRMKTWMWVPVGAAVGLVSGFLPDRADATAEEILRLVLMVGSLVTLALALKRRGEGDRFEAMWHLVMTAVLLTVGGL